MCTDTAFPMLQSKHITIRAEHSGTGLLAVSSPQSCSDREKEDRFVPHTTVPVLIPKHLFRNSPCVVEPQAPTISRTRSRRHADILTRCCYLRRSTFHLSWGGLEAGTHCEAKATRTHTHTHGSACLGNTITWQVSYFVRLKLILFSSSCGEENFGFFQHKFHLDFEG